MKNLVTMGMDVSIENGFLAIGKNGGHLMVGKGFGFQATGATDADEGRDPSYEE